MDKDAGTTASMALFSAVVCLFVAHQKRHGERSDVGTIRCVGAGEQHAGLSGRGEALLSTPSLPYIFDYLKCLQDSFDPLTNPEGYIPLCIAENKLVVEAFASRLMQPGTATTAFSDITVYCYNGTLGLPPARESVAYFLAKHFLLASSSPESDRRGVDAVSCEEAWSLIRPEHVVLGAGAASLLNHLAVALAEDGDAVLCPAPYYAAFDTDTKFLAGCVTVPVQCDDATVGPTVAELENAAKSAESRGLRPRMIIVTNPTNPLGTIYSREVMKETIEWARGRNIHTIVDEVYGLSTHERFGHGFESALKTLDNNLGDDVHHLWALSKDFGASGFRIGTLYTQNDRLLSAISNLNIFSTVSHPMQMIIAEVLADDVFINWFLDEARERIRPSYELCARKLESMVVPFVRPKAGIFVYADFSALLPSPTFEGEARFAKLVQEAAHVVMTPGNSQHDRKPGMFRICYCCVKPDVLDVAMGRLERLVAKIRRWHWDNDSLNPESLKDILT